MFSFQMMIEKIFKKKTIMPGTTTITELCYFLGFCSFLPIFFFLMECAECLYNFVQMTAEPRKTVAVIDT